MRDFVGLSALMLLLATAKAAVDTGITSRSVCTVSGDPHWRTFDNTRTDPQGTGVYTMVDNQFFRVQCRQHRCNKRARKPVTCLSWCTFGVKKFGSVLAGVAWGSRSGQPFYENVTGFEEQAAFPSEIDPVQLLLPTNDPLRVPRGCTLMAAGPPASYTCPNNQQYDMIVTDDDGWPSQWRFRFDQRSMSLYEVDANGEQILNGNNFYYRRHYLRIYASNTPANREAADGLCGWFDNDPTFEFVNTNDFSLWANSRAGARVNGPAIQQWFAQRAVTDPNEMVLPLRHPHTHEVMMVPTPEGPSAEQAELTPELEFASQEHFEQVKALCTEITAGNPEATFARDACIIDGALMSENGVITDNAREMMQSQSFAATDTASSNINESNSSDDGLSDGAIAGIVVGTVAAVSLVVVGAVFLRLRKTQRHLSQALVLVGGGSATESGVQLSGNL